MQASQTTSLSREELHKLVWSKPLTTIEKELNITTLEIKNTCEKFKIPMPENGYWSKLKFNKQQPISELEPLEDEELKNVQNVLEINEIEISPLKKINLRKAEIEKTLNLKVPDKITSLNPILEKVKSDLTEKYKSPHYGDDFPFTSNGVFSISISKESIPRALRLINTFVNLMQKRGHSFKIERETEVIVFNEAIYLRLREKRERYVKEISKYGTEYHGYRPTGNLYFIIDRWSRERTYADSEKEKLENKLSHIIAYLEIQGEKKVQERIESDEWHRIREIERIKEEKIKQQIEAEKQKVKQLYINTENWVQACNLRNYIKALEQNAIQTNSLNQEKKDYIEWGNKQADLIDPLNLKNL